MSVNHVSEASKMMNFLKKEEAFYKKALQHMEQEYMRLQIEELTLKAAIRQEQMKVDSLNRKEEKQSSQFISTLQEKNSINDAFNSEIDRQNDITISSNITDDRYLETLILNPNSFGGDSLMEFDD